MASVKVAVLHSRYIGKSSKISYNATLTNSVFQSFQAFSEKGGKIRTFSVENTNLGGNLIEQKDRGTNEAAVR